MCSDAGFMHAVGELATLERFLSALRVDLHVSIAFDVALVPHTPHYHGPIFQVASLRHAASSASGTSTPVKTLSSGASSSGHRVALTLAAGGRFTRLVDRFCRPTDVPFAGSVAGVEVAWERLVQEALETRGRVPASHAPAQAHVPLPSVLSREAMHLSVYLLQKKRLFSNNFLHRL